MRGVSCLSAWKGSKLLQGDKPLVGYRGGEGKKTFWGA